MPIAKFQFPDGRIGRFEVPDGTTPEQAQALIEQMIGSGLTPDQPMQLPELVVAPEETGGLPAEEEALALPPAEAPPVQAEPPALSVSAFQEPQPVVEAPAGEPERGVLGTVADVGRGLVEAVTGSELETETIRAMPEWTSMPELNSASFRSALTGLGTLLANPDEIAQVVEANFPDTQVFQDEKGNYIFRSSLDGRDYAIKPGMRVSDVPRVIGGIAAFTPAGRATTIPRAGAGAALTQTGIEATQLAAGGEFDQTEVGMAGATGAAVPAVGRVIQAGRDNFKGEPPPVHNPVGCW
jgi:hypothetical protein